MCGEEQTPGQQSEGIERMQTCSYSSIFEAESTEGRGTMIELSKTLSTHHPRATPELVALIGSELAKLIPAGPLEVIREQNRESLRTLEDLKARQLQSDQMYRDLSAA